MGLGDQKKHIMESVHTFDKISMNVDAIERITRDTIEEIVEYYNTLEVETKCDVTFKNPTKKKTTKKKTIKKTSK